MGIGTFSNFNLREGSFEAQWRWRSGRCDEARSVLCWPDLALRYLVGNQLQSISFWFGSDIKYIIRSRNVCFRFISMFLLTD